MWKVKEWLRPASPEQAAQLLAELGPKARVVAGGTRVVARPDLEFLVDISKLDLRDVSVGADVLRLGSGVSLQTLVDAKAVIALASGILAAAARHTHSNLVRNRATLGGEIATAEPTSEILAALLALGASLELLSPERRTVTLDRYLADPTAFSGALITAVHIPLGWTSGGFSRAARSVSDRPIVSATFAFRGDAAGGSGGLGLVGGARRVLGFNFEVGIPSSWEQIAPLVEPALDPPSDIRGSSQYRRLVIPVVVRRAMRAALEVVR
jgi:CO/xanthine dehydrogenase FAD-binding subunit